ncbi:RagB/SusD family nutrient uptake outer membrane protein [Mucilaginibacter psychrotolerans]|uniref:RagB/SusD family nutrient uptake outer membrane protein n=1 Tax=Mucilaginibacter psychrotolerans TaxID=1524096 RepID=A0A4Y8SEB7_9SPHI|nr:RagB/SusD family nutrient uptake outer membrane protein [Mucilaginibacter psychrotolerans]TFF37021.1 RagB/SusD family nutrient uptake outer membrane protein [Mucilaginibacter psychrotolerans]
MYNTSKYIVLVIFLTVTVSFQSCKKDWLNGKPDKSLVVPQSIKDFQALLDNTTQTFNNSQGCGLGEISAGDFNITFASWQSLFTNQEKSAYIWEETSDFYKGETSSDWVSSYKRVLNANVVLDGISKVNPAASDIVAWNNVKGSALFFRAFDFFNLSQEFCKVYNSSSAQNDLGIPLRLEYDINVPAKRSTLQNTYDQIISDLKSAASLLNTTPLYKTRPSKQAAFALLARTYLSMKSYGQAGLYADSALQIQHDLLDYTKLNVNSNNPFARFNAEVIFQSIFSYGIFSTSKLIVEPSLYSQYSQNDLRKSAYFLSLAGGGVAFKGSYNGDKNLFGGLTTDELYLIRAECNARNGNIPSALSDYNALLKTRWSGTYTNFTTTDPKLALSQIISERRKELVFRGLRWTDLRRLNTEDDFKQTLVRTLNGQTYTLAPNDPKYVFPIDETEIRLSGIQQNDR